MATDVKVPALGESITEGTAALIAAALGHPSTSASAPSSDRAASATVAAQ